MATATLTYPGTDTVPGDNTATIGTSIQRTADLSVALARSTAETSLDAVFSYTATVRNDGPNPAPVQLAIPVTNATVLNITGDGGTCSLTPGSAACSHPMLASGASWEIIVNASATTPATAQAAATLSSPSVDPDDSDNQATADVMVSRVGDLSVSMTESQDPAVTGTPFNYIATINNLGPNSGGVQISVPITGATATGATASSGTCTTTASQVTCTIASLDNGSTATVRIDMNAAATGTAQATATVTFSDSDPVSANNSATVSTTVNSPPPAAASGGGGGGRFDWLALALLAAFAWRRRRGLSARREPGAICGG
jgi:hypothetical protein